MDHQDQSEKLVLWDVQVPPVDVVQWANLEMMVHQDQMATKVDEDDVDDQVHPPQESNKPLMRV